MTAGSGLCPPLVSVREATPDDEERIAEHRRAATVEAGRYRGSMMPVGDPTEAGPELCWVAEIAGETVGSLSGREEGAGTWMVLAVYTEPEARGIGVADALLEHFRRHATSRGARSLLSRALPGDREMKNLFERHGFSARLIVLGTELRD